MFDIDLLDHSRRVPRHDHEVWNVLGDYAASTNSYTTANSNARTDDDVAAEPAVLTNSNWSAEFRTISSVAEERVEWMGGSVEGTVWADKGAGADGDETCVKEDGIEVNVHIFTDSAECQEP